MLDNRIRSPNIKSGVNGKYLTILGRLKYIRFHKTVIKAYKNQKLVLFFNYTASVKEYVTKITQKYRGKQYLQKNKHCGQS